MKSRWPEEAEESSDSISMKRFCWVSFTGTDYPVPFSNPCVGFVVGSEADIELVFWRPGQIMVRLFSNPSVSLIIM